jgi:hypothetical protein
MKTGRGKIPGRAQANFYSCYAKKNAHKEQRDFTYEPQEFPQGINPKQELADLVRLYIHRKWTRRTHTIKPNCWE